ncbi:amino acid adenylation domain-containing protein [Ramlibacter sp.]|uniref:amino acid adenylation domain-containing protein n=1 Tax=Ramlibacter sp. TaxID=1917967 RepID=UPI0018179E67|nr:amino acid adenylation domain-containing protein [Ramlibacter sp.]MBA2675267.1 amino acid adenylation domain-containing protein [Ramlibacter sp.]
MTPQTDSGATVHRRFAAQAHRTPDATALVGSHARLTYRELDNCARHLAQRLVAAGVQPGDTVPMCLPRSVEAVVAMLAIMKAGAAFVPVDPVNPEAMKRDCLQQCRARHMLVAPSDDGAWAGELQVARIDAAGLLAARDVDTEDVDGGRDGDASGESAVYVMFTSGSTGRPKGVVVPHRAVIRLVCDPDWIRVDARDTLLLLSPISFDASTFELWGALLNGAKLVVWDDAAFDPNRLVERVRSEGVTVLWLTAALFHMMVRRRIDMFPGLRVLLAGGDVLRADAINAVLDACEGITVINGYGPTENTTFTCCHAMTRANRPTEPVPIGRAISGTQVHILDANRQPVPQGEEGELCAGGLGVALGYLNAPDATRAAFVPQPDGSLMYRTGDLVRRDAEGLIHFLGRRDRLTKIRGFRVSVDEVQALIGRIPGAEENIVEVRSNANGDTCLEAFIQSAERGNDMVAFIRGELRKAAPAYMIPERITVCAELPLNANGKVDRQRTTSITQHTGEHHG